MIKQKYFTNLDTIRFIAATMVCLTHSVGIGYRKSSLSPFFKTIVGVIANGGTGVSIFFVLSGFLITYLLITEYEKNDKVEVVKFYIRRVLRIWPLYYSVLLFTFVIYPGLKTMIHMNHPLCSNFLYHISFLSNFDVINIHKYCPGEDAASQNITWSVSVEEQFYLFWPLIFKFFPRKSWLYILLTIICCSLWFRIVNINNDDILYYHTVSVLIDLAVGGLFAILIKQYNKVRIFFESISTLWHIIFFTLTIIVLFSAQFFDSLPYGRAYYRIITALSFAFVISSQSLTTQTSVFNLKNFTFANKYGKYTYGIYLLHPIVTNLMDVICRLLKISEGLFQSTLIVILVFICTLLLSKISYEKFEKIFLKIKHKKFEVVRVN